jgi:hypothetical protein
VFDPSERPAGTVFIADLTRGYRQGAVFGEVAFDILPKTLTLTVGSRYYHFNNYIEGQSDRNTGAATSIRACLPMAVSRLTIWLRRIRGTRTR